MSESRRLFAKCLAKHLAARGARAALAERLGTNRSTVSNVLAARWVPANPEEWADALGLVGSDRREFVMLGHLAASPDAVSRHTDAWREFALADLKPGESRSQEVSELEPHVQARIRAVAAIEERRVTDDQLRTALREQIEIRQALAIHLKNAESKASKANGELAALRAQLTALLSTPTPPTLETLDTTDKTPEPRSVPTPDEVMAATRRLARRNRDDARTATHAQAPTEAADRPQPGDPRTHGVPPATHR